MFNLIQEHQDRLSINMENNKNTVLTEEEKTRKERLRTRLFALLVGVDILLVAYLIYEMISIFTKKS